MRRRKQQKIKYYAKILIAFSIALLIYGVFLDYGSDTKLYNPITDATTVKGDNTTIDINTSGELIENFDKENSTQSKQSNTDTTVPSIQDSNDGFRRQLEDKYGISIKYGSETDGYEVGGLTTESITNGSRVSSALTSLNNCLSNYPEDMFKELRDGGIPLTVYLIEKYSLNGVTGVTDSSSDYANISIAIAYPFEESFYHESYHYIEKYMIDKKNLSFTNWNGYNPPGFVYGEANYEYSYTANGGREDSYFVNNYAQSAESEDRASTFEYMMDETKANCLNHNQPVWKKAKLMAEAIDAALTTCSPYVTEYWERFL